MKKRIFIILLVLLIFLVSCKELNTKYVNEINPDINTSFLVAQKDNIQVYRFLDEIKGQGLFIVCYFTVNTISKNAPSMIACH